MTSPSESISRFSLSIFVFIDITLSIDIILFKNENLRC